MPFDALTDSGNDLHEVTPKKVHEDTLYVTVTDPDPKPHDYEAEPVSIIIVLDAETGLWHLFEGTFDIKTKAYKVVVAINAFPCNVKDPLRLPDQVFRMALACATARKCGLWIP